MFSFFGGGLGGNPESDGLNHGNNPISTATIPPVEILEAVLSRDVHAMGAAAGQRRRRPASRRPRRDLRDRSAGETGADVFLFGERGKFAPFGVNGGGAAALNRFVFDTPDGQAIAAAGLEDHRREDRARASASGWKRPAAAATATAGARAIRRRSRAISASATSAASARHARRDGMSGSSIVGVDVGGTFTDLFFFDEARATFRTAKVPSQRGDEADGLSATACTRFGPDRRSRRHRARHHGRHQRAAGAQGRAHRPDHHARAFATCWRCAAATGRRPGACGAISSRSSTATCASRSPSACWPTARIRTRGRSRRGAAQAREAAGARAREALAIIFINAYANPPTSARRWRPRARSGPTTHVAASSEILPEIREFERTSTTALNAYLQPVVGRYLGKLAGRAGERRLRRPVPHRAVQRRRDVDGDGAPPAGAHRAVRPGRRRDRRRRHRRARRASPNVITGDLGGTSFDVSLIAGGQAALAAQTTIDFGLVIRTPMIEITTIGAGGGSIAHVDRGGLLQVGPESAGSVPGPVCYGARQRPADADRRQCRARPHQRRPADRRQARAARCRGRQGRDPTPCRRAARPRRHGGGRGHRARSPTRAWPARSGWSRSSAGMIPANFAMHAVRRRRRAACRRADRARSG